MERGLTFITCPYNIGDLHLVLPALNFSRNWFKIKGETKLSDNFHKKSLMLIYFDLCCYKIMVTAMILETRPGVDKVKP